MGGDRRADRVKIDIGKETEPKMITDLLEVHLDGVGTICFTKSNGARIRKDFGSAFFFDGSTIHGNLFVNIKEGNGIYSVQFVEIETQISVTTILSDMMGNAAAIHAIQVGWGEFRKIYSHPRECQWYTQVQPQRRTFRREQEGLCDRSTKGLGLEDKNGKPSLLMRGQDFVIKDFHAIEWAKALIHTATKRGSEK